MKTRIILYFLFIIVFIIGGLLMWDVSPKLAIGAWMMIASFQAAASLFEVDK